MSLPQNVKDAIALLRGEASSIILAPRQAALTGAIDLLERELREKYPDGSAPRPSLHSRMIKALRWVGDNDGTANVQALDAPTIPILDVLFHKGLIETIDGAMVPIFRLTDKGRWTLEKEDNG